MENKTLKVDLTFTPKSIYSTILLAKAQDYFRKEGINVELVWAKSDRLTAQQCVDNTIHQFENNSIDLAVLPSDELVYQNVRAKNKQHHLIAVATLVPKDFTCVVCLKDRGSINSPKDLAGKIYASHGFRFCEGMVQKLMEADGGKGKVHPVVCSMSDTLLGLFDGRWEAARASMVWHVLMAEKEGKHLRTFKFDDYDVVHGYRLLLVGTEQNLRQEHKKEWVKSFMRAVRRAHEDLVKEDPKRVASMLSEFFDHPNLKDTEFLRDSIHRSKEYMAPNGREWGMMDEELWRKYIDFLSSNRMLKDENGEPIQKEKIEIKSLFTHEFLRD